MDTDFVNKYVTLLLQHIPSPILSWGQLVEILLREEFRDEISEPLMLPPTSEIANKRKRYIHHEKHSTPVSNANKTQGIHPVLAWVTLNDLCMSVSMPTTRAANGQHCLFVV